MKPKHTKGPWKVVCGETPRQLLKIFALRDDGIQGRCILNIVRHPSDCPQVPMREFRFSEIDLANAERIVECVNALDGVERPEDLVAAVKGLLEWWEGLEDGFDHEDLCDRIQALAEAMKGKKQHGR